MSNQKKDPLATKIIQELNDLFVKRHVVFYSTDTETLKADVGCVRLYLSTNNFIVVDDNQPYATIQKYYSPDFKELYDVLKAHADEAVKNVENAAEQMFLHITRELGNRIG